MQDPIDKRLQVPTWNAWTECWKHRKKYLWCSILFAVLSVVYGISIPSVYVGQIKVTDETKGMDIMIGLDNISAYIKSMSTDLEPMDNPEIYASIIYSQDFIEEIGKIELSCMGITYQEYIEKNYRRPWWEMWFERLYYYGLSQKEIAFETIKNNIQCQLFNKYHSFTLQVEDNNPVIAAQMVDSICQHLDQRVANYRKQNAIMRMELYSREQDMALEEFHAAQKQYSDYCERHINAITHEEITTTQFLCKERDAKMLRFQQVSEKVKRYEALALRHCNTFTVLKNSTVLHSPVRPLPLVSLLLSLFVGNILLTWWLFYKKTKNVSSSL